MIRISGIFRTENTENEVLGKLVIAWPAKQTLA